MKFSTLLLSSALFAGSVSAADLTAVPSGKYFVDPTHAYINFQYNHLGLSNPVLQFDEFKMSMDLDNANPTNTKVNVEIVTYETTTDHVERADEKEPHTHEARSVTKVYWPATCATDPPAQTVLLFLVLRIKKKYEAMAQHRTAQFQD